MLFHRKMFAALLVGVACLVGYAAPFEDVLAEQSAKIREGKTSIPTLLAGYREAMRREPSNPKAYVLAAAAYDRPESRTLFEKAISLSPNYLPARVGFARYLLRQDREADAFVQFDKALASDPSNESLRIEAINAAVRAKRTTDAEQLVGTKDVLRIELINTLTDEQQFDAARNLLSRLSDRTTGPALAAEGRLTYLEAQSKKDADARTRGIELLLSSWRKSPELMLHYRMFYPRRSTVQTLTEAKRMSELKEVLEKGIALYPKEYALYEALWKLQFAPVKSDYAAERANVVSQVNSLIASKPAEPELLKVAALGYKMAEATTQADATNKRLVVEFPYSMPAQMIRRTEAVFEKDPNKKLTLLREFNRDIVSMPMYQEYFETLDKLNVPDAELLKGAKEFMDSTPYSHAVWYISEVFLRRGIFLDQLSVWLDQHAGIVNPPTNAWTARVRTMKGKLLLLKNKPNEAEALLRPLPGLELQGYSNVDKGKAQFFLAEVLEAKKQVPEAMELYAQSYAQSQHYIAEAGDSFRRLYQQLNNATAGMQTYLESREAMYQVAATTGIERGTKIDKPSPDFSMLSLTGERVTLASIKGKVAVVNFWATWCGPCIKELPHFQEFHEKMKGDPGVVVLAVTTDENRALVQPFISKNKYTFTVLYDEGLKSELGIRGIPATFVIDPKGIIRLRMIGFNNNEPLVPYLTKLVQQYREPQTAQAPTPSRAKEAFQSVDRVPKRAMTDAEWRAKKKEAAIAALATLVAPPSGDDLYYVGMLEVMAEKWRPAVEHLRALQALPETTNHEARMNRLLSKQTLQEAFLKGGFKEEGEKYYEKDPVSLAIFVSMEGDQERTLAIYEKYLASNPPPERQRMTKSLILITLGSMNRRDEMATRLEAYRADLTPNALVNSYSTLARLYAEAGDEKKAELYTQKLFDYGKQSKDGKAVDGPVTAHINWQIKRLEAANDPGKLNDFIHYVKTEFANNKSVMGNLESREVFRRVLNQPAKELEVAYFVNGTKTDLKSLKGKVVMLDFFAHWCGPCIADFPVVRDLQQRYEKRGLAILGLTGVYGYYQGDKALTPEQEVEQMRVHFAKEYQVTWPMLFATTKTNDTNYGVGYIPHLVLIDRNGIVRFAKVGRSDEKELEAQIQKLLSEASN